MTASEKTVSIGPISQTSNFEMARSNPSTTEIENQDKGGRSSSSLEREKRPIGKKTYPTIAKIV